MANSFIMNELDLFVGRDFMLLGIFPWGIY